MNWFKTDDIRIQDIEPLISPAILIKDYPATTEIAKMVATTRKNAENIISGHDDRLLVVVGPCSIHDPPGCRGLCLPPEGTNGAL